MYRIHTPHTPRHGHPLRQVINASSYQSTASSPASTHKQSEDETWRELMVRAERIEKAMTAADPDTEYLSSTRPRTVTPAAIATRLEDIHNVDTESDVDLSQDKIPRASLTVPHDGPTQRKGSMMLLSSEKPYLVSRPIQPRPLPSKLSMPDKSEPVSYSDTKMPYTSVGLSTSHASTTIPRGSTEANTHHRSSHHQNYHHVNQIEMDLKQSQYIILMM
jgi:hypothetical protein